MSMRDAVVLLAVLAACPGPTPKETNHMTEQSSSDLAARLVAAGYDGLFLSGDHSRAETIWMQGQNQKQLERLVFEPDASLHAKFLAAELLRENGVTIAGDAAPILAEAYAQALASTSDAAGNPWRLNGNLWGFLQHADDPGHLGAVVIGLGKVAVPYLLKLLGDTGPVFYEGSREATTGNRLKFRIKDFAAYYIGKIEGVPVPLHDEHAARDAEIERLRVAVAALRKPP